MILVSKVWIATFEFARKLRSLDDFVASVWKSPLSFERTWKQRNDLWEMCIDIWLVVAASSVEDFSGLPISQANLAHIWALCKLLMAKSHSSGSNAICFSLAS